VVLVVDVLSDFVEEDESDFDSDLVSDFDSDFESDFESVEALASTFLSELPEFEPEEPFRA
jgi:hypothetical protein